MAPAVAIEEFLLFIKQAADEADQSLVELTLGAATRVAEGVIGGRPIVQRSVTSRVRGGGLLRLPKTPVVSIETVSEFYPSGASWVAADFVIDDPLAGLIGLANGSPLPTSAGPRSQWYVVEYTAGLFADVGSVDEDCKLAVNIIGQHLWRTRYGRAARPGVLGERDSNVEDNGAGNAGFLVPNRAVELLAPYGPGAVFA